MLDYVSISLHCATFQDQKLPVCLEALARQEDGGMCSERLIGFLAVFLIIGGTSLASFSISRMIFQCRGRAARHYLSTGSLGLSPEDILFLDQYNFFGKNSSQ
jgi:hypothetical protein